MDKTLFKGLQVLELVAKSEGRMRITDVATALALTKSNAYRVLRTLEAAGFLKQDPVGKSFIPSLKLWELGTNVISHFDLRTRAAETLKMLADESRETVHLSILEGNEVIYVDKIDSLEPVSAYTRLGGRAPAYCVATGKALLSRLPEAELAPILAHLERHSPNTITDPEALRAELAEARARGYAINRGEWREGVWGLATAFSDPMGAFSAAVGVSGPQYRLDVDNRCEKLAVMVQVAARNILKAMSYK